MIVYLCVYHIGVLAKKKKKKETLNETAKNATLLNYFQQIKQVQLLHIFKPPLKQVKISV